LDSWGVGLVALDSIFFLFLRPVFFASYSLGRRPLWPGGLGASALVIFPLSTRILSFVYTKVCLNSRGELLFKRSVRAWRDSGDEAVDSSARTLSGVRVNLAPRLPGRFSLDSASGGGRLPGLVFSGLTASGTISSSAWVGCLLGERRRTVVVLVLSASGAISSSAGVGSFLLERRRTVVVLVLSVSGAISSSAGVGSFLLERRRTGMVVVLSASGAISSSTGGARVCGLRVATPRSRCSL